MPHPRRNNGAVVENCPELAVTAAQLGHANHQFINSFGVFNSLHRTSIFSATMNLFTDREIVA